MRAAGTRLPADATRPLSRDLDLQLQRQSARSTRTDTIRPVDPEQGYLTHSTEERPSSRWPACSGMNTAIRVRPFECGREEC